MRMKLRSKRKKLTKKKWTIMLAMTALREWNSRLKKKPKKMTNPYSKKLSMEKRKRRRLETKKSK